ncbi:hypothetical protein [Crocosphaera sp. XPORK-15E]|uniref:hypothetical protein n=1 Tax=Crocosphaera sp. XPORK-15E TaxID=3110247 RepID=UPI002B1F16C5|nr:hypothetical protein [Crocosphaera sp. XPORK-15E]MEA5533800.1 hypothetical protein [Crocosphaera sp. XPORK-15E]
MSIEISDLQLCLMLIFNAVLCLLLPRLLTMNWLAAFSSDDISTSSASQLDAVTVTQKITIK